MTTYKRCPECGGLLEDDGACSCGFRAKRAGKKAAEHADAVLCAWDDHGARCPCRGVISTTTNGGGTWYCREHWERIAGRDADVTGNGLPDHAKRPSESMIDFLKRRARAG